MKTLMIFTLLLGLTALAGMLFSRPPSEDDARGQALAVSFGIFRRAAWQFAHDNPEHQGVIPANALLLPDGMNTERWQARMNNGVCYVWGELPGMEIGTILNQYRNSQAIGQARAGTLRPWGYILPDFIPAGALVSLMEVQ